MVKRKPAGLGRKGAADESVEKKVRGESATDITAKSLSRAPDDGDENTVTMTVPESLDEVSELKALFESALSKLGDGDVDEGRMLLRGVIHESDRILRQRSDSASAESVEQLSWEFHFIYGSALYRLGLLILHDADEGSEMAAEKEAIDYFDAAIERLETGLDTEKSWVLLEAAGRVMFDKVNLQIKSSDNEGDFTETSNKAVDMLCAAVAALTDSDIYEAIGMANLLLHHLEYRLDWKEHSKLTAIAQGWFKKVLSVNKGNYEALKGLGSSYLNAANTLLELADRGEQIENCDLSERLDSALNHFYEARKQLSEDSDDISLLLLLGECLVNRANVLDEEDESDAADLKYKEAVGCFRKVEQFDPSALPEQFSEFLKEWEEDLKTSSNNQ